MVPQKPIRITMEITRVAAAVDMCHSHRPELSGGFIRDRACIPAAQSNGKLNSPAAAVLQGTRARIEASERIRANAAPSRLFGQERMRAMRSSAAKAARVAAAALAGPSRASMSEELQCTTVA